MNEHRHRRARGWLVASLAAGIGALIPTQALAISTTIVNDGPAGSGAEVPNIFQAKIESADDGSLGVELQIDKPMEYLDMDFEKIGHGETYLDLDNNPATTGPQDGLVPGAETLVSLYNSGSRINGAIDGIALLDSFSSDASGTTIWWRVADLRHLGVVPGSVIGVRFVSDFDGGGTKDYLPDLGPGSTPTWIPYQVSAAAPPAPAVPAPSLVPQPAVVAAPRTIVAHPFLVSPLTLSTLPGGRVRATFRWSGATSRVTWKVRLSFRSGGSMHTRLLTGSSTKAGTGISRVENLRLPAGARVSARLDLKHGGRAYGKSASTRRPSR